MAPALDRLDRLVADSTRILKLAMPVIVARLGIMAMAVVDTMVVGQYSTVELAYITIAFVPMSIMLVGGIGLLGGTGVMTARLRGADRHGEVGAVWHRALLYAGALTAPSLILGLIGAPLLVLLGQEGRLADGAAPAMLVLAIGMPFQFAFFAASQFLEGLNRPLPGMVLMLVANLVNLALNLLLVSGGLGLPALGAVGTAWATTGSRAFLAIGLAIVIARQPDRATLGLTRVRAPGHAAADSPKPLGALLKGPEAREQWTLGLTTAASHVLEQSSFAAMVVMAGWLGAEALAAMSIATNLLGLIFMIGLGVGVAGAVLVAEAHGAGVMARAVRLGWTALGLAFLLVGLAALPLIIAPTLVAEAYTGDRAVIALVGHLIVIMGATVVFDGLQTVAAQALRARGDTWMPTASHFLSYLVVMAPLAWALAFPLGRGAVGLVEAIAIASVLSASLLMSRFALLARRDRNA